MAKKVTGRPPRADGSRAALIQIAAWFGLVAGLTEVALRIVQKFALNQRISLSDQFVWMAPLADLAIYGVIGLCVAAVIRRRPQWVGVGAVVFLSMFVYVAVPLHAFQRLHGAAVLLVALGVAYQASRLARCHSDRLLRLVRLTMVPLLAVVALLALGVNGWIRVGERRGLAELPTAAADAPNIVLLILDTVGATSLRLYGYDRALTPNLARLASDAVVFERAIAPSPWTLPSHASMFTGQFPDVLDADWKVAMGDRYPTLAEVLSKSGYVTAGFSGNLRYATSDAGLARGFNTFEDYPISFGTIVASSLPARLIASRVRRWARVHGDLIRHSAASINRRMLAWVDAHTPTSRPFFAFINYYDAHDPYLPPAPFDTLYGGIVPMEPLSLHEPWSDDELERSRAAYDAAVTYLDHELGLLIAGLERRGLLDNTIIIVTGDHGEHFGEHGLLYHANSLYLPLLHVPLIVRLPEGGGERHVARTVSLADLAATILHIAGLPTEPIAGVPLIGPAGKDIGAAVRRARAFVSKTINMAGWLPSSQGDMASLTDASLHYIRNGDGREELYSYRDDPFETRDLAAVPAYQSRLEDMRGIVAGQPSRARSMGMGGRATGGAQ